MKIRENGMKKTIAWAVAALALWATAAWAAVDSRVFPVPRYEAEQVIASWLRKGGFDVQSTSAPDQAHIRAARKTDAWDIVLMHRSTLATWIAVEESPGGTGAALWEYLAGYLHADAQTQAVRSTSRVPAPVIARMDLVVCIRAEVKGTPIQLTGFVVDPSGLVLCTAHTLVDPDVISIILSNGNALKGKIVRINFKKDLALIDCTYAFGRAVALAGDRPVPATGTKLYSAGCPLNLGGTLVSGVISGTPKLVEGQPLLQVRMEVEPGSSGSPVFDGGGNLVAVVKGRLKGDNFAGLLIPMETVLSFVKGN
jgi:serine protease Do